MRERSGNVKALDGNNNLPTKVYDALTRFYTAKEAAYMSIRTESPLDRLNRSFTPHKPIFVPEFFAGRKKLLYRAIDAVHTDGRHLVIFGDRGTGKTSLARILTLSVQEPDNPTGIRAIVVSCTAADDYSAMWRKVFQEVYVAQRQLGFVQDATAPVLSRIDLDDKLEDPNDVRLVVRTLPNPVVIVFDEFDQIPNAAMTNRLMAQTIKLFADTDVNSTIVLVGVADSIDDLFAEHRSVERNLGQVQVLPMERGELTEIVQRGFRYAGLEWDKRLDAKIADLSQGYPHYTHLLGLWAGRRALEAGRVKVTNDDLDTAIQDALDNAAGGVQQEYERAVASQRGRHHLFKEVLLACALAEKDSLGRFPAVSVREPMRRITDKDYGTGAFQSHLAKFTEDARGPVLKKTGTKRNYRWQFINPQLIPFVRLEGIRTGLLVED